MVIPDDDPSSRESRDDQGIGVTYAIASLCETSIERQATLGCGSNGSSRDTRATSTNVAKLLLVSVMKQDTQPTDCSRNFSSCCGFRSAFPFRDQQMENNFNSARAKFAQPESLQPHIILSRKCTVVRVHSTTALELRFAHNLIARAHIHIQKARRLSRGRT